MLPRATPWKSAGSTASATAHGSSTANATTVVATARAAVVRGKLRPINHGNPRKSAAIAMAETAAAISTAICGHGHGNTAITTEVRGSPRQLPWQFPRASNRNSSPQQQATCIINRVKQSAVLYLWARGHSLLNETVDIMPEIQTSRTLVVILRSVQAGLSCTIRTPLRSR